MTERLKLAQMLAALPLDQSHDTWPTVVPVRLTETDRELIVNVLRAQPQPSRETKAAKPIEVEDMMRANDVDALLDHIPSFAGIKPRTWDDLFELLRDHGGIGFARKWIERLTELRTALTSPVSLPQSSLGQSLTILTVDLSNPVAGDAK